MTFARPGDYANSITLALATWVMLHGIPSIPGERTIAAG